MALPVEQIAQVTHAANRVIQALEADPTIPVSPEWADLDEHTKASIMNGVVAILDGRITAPSQSHENWVKFKRDEGWTYGEVKDGEAKTHPLLVPYDELSAEARRKDSLFFAIVEALGRDD